MPSDPQLLSEILAGPLEEADYDTIYADLMATPRGRWFLTEYAGRNRFADTHMLAGAIARVEAAVRGEPDPQVPAAVAREIADLAVAIGRIEDEFAAPLRLASEGLSAAERIQDVAFALREREVDAAMSDVLEAAIRELGETFARGDAAAERAQNALALLRELKGRVHAMVADAVVATAVPSAAVTPGETQSDAVADDGFGGEGDVSDALLAERSAADAQADEHFAAMIGALAASFPEPDERPASDDIGEPAPEPAGQFADAAAPAAELEAASEPTGEPPAEAGQGGTYVGSADTELSPAESSPSSMPTTEEASVAEPVGDEAPVQQEFETADVESERSEVENAGIAPPAVPEPAEHEPAVVQLLGTEELAEEERLEEPTASGPLDEVVLPDQPVSGAAAAEDVATERLADHSLALADASDAGNQSAAATVALGAIEDGGTPSEYEAPPTLAESPAADIVELPGTASSEPVLPDDAGDGSAVEEPPNQASSPERSDATVGDVVPLPHLPNEPSIGPVDLPTTNLPAADLAATDLPEAAEAVVAELAPRGVSEPEDVPSEPVREEREENVVLVSRDETEIVRDEAVGTTADDILGSANAPRAESVERFDHTAKDSIIEPTQAPATVEHAPTSLTEAETTRQSLPDLQASPGPDEDPADLFEPLPMPSPIPAPLSVPETQQSTAATPPGATAAVSLFDTSITYDGGAAVPGTVAAVELQGDARTSAAAAQTNHAVPAGSPAAGFFAAPSPQMRLPLETSTPQSPPRAAAPVLRSISRPSPSDPLASIHALSEEELIALFS